MNLRKNVITVLILVVSILILGNVKCYAASASFSLNKSKVTLVKGKSTTFTITTKNCEGKFLAKSSDESVVTLSQTSEIDCFLGNIPTITITAKKAGTATISVIADDVTDNDANEVVGTKTIKVTVEEEKIIEKEDKNDKKEENKKEEEKENVVKVSTDATLKNLGITPTKYDFSGFKKATTSYEVKVPYEAEKISIYADANSSKATVTGTGSKTLKVGENSFKVKVTAEDKKTTKTYTLKITRQKEAEISTDATLKNLGITPTKYDFSGFRKMTTSYDVKVPYEAEKINVYADASDEKATVTGAGSKTLEVGENTFKIKVTAEDKKTIKTYTLKITREEKEIIEDEETPEDESDNTEGELLIFSEGIIKLEVEGYNLLPEFNTRIYEYSVNVTSDVKSLDIKVEKEHENVTIDIAGNEDLKLGENIITILVNNGNYNKTTTYQINVNVKENKIDLTEVNNSISFVQRKLIAKRVIIVGTLIIIGVLIIAFVIEKNKILSKNEFLENNNTDRIDLTKDENMFDRINGNSQSTKKKSKKTKGKRFK